MIAAPACYILRVDDLCPTVNRERWLRLAALIEEHGLKPILAIVPDNRDPDLCVSSPDENFWERMRDLQRSGAAIALHGYRHMAQSRGRSLVPIRSKSEFAGVAESVQGAWIYDSLEILRSHGLDATIWVAPRHGFDRNTLKALRAEGIRVLSDGFAPRPFMRGGVTWIPQQLWAPVLKRAGLWTICLHPNTMIEAQFDELSAFLNDHGKQFISVEEALAHFPPSRLSVSELLNEKLAYARLAARRLKHGMTDRLVNERDSAAAHRQPTPEIRPPSASSHRPTRDTVPRAGRARLQG
jgi:peptidoglycan/xylan/chitin deacetylase (PgdA/CDA1 family)